MSKKNRSSRPFRTLGQRMLSFGRDVMRTYSNDVSLQPQATNNPEHAQGQWRAMSNAPLLWKQEQPTTPAPVQPDLVDNTLFDESDYQPEPQPIQRRPQPQITPVQREPEAPQKPSPNYVQMNDGTPVRVSQKQFSNPMQRRLESIMAAHADVNAEREKEREQKIENIQRKMESGELTTHRRRGSIEVDYVSTDSLVSPDERDKIQTKQDPQIQSPPSTHDEPDDTQWFDDIPDDNADIDSLAGFDSAQDDLTDLPDDLPRFDTSSLEENNSDNMGEFEGGYEFETPSVTTENSIQNVSNDTPVQHTAIDSTSDDSSTEFGEQTQADANNLNSDLPANDAPIQRNAYDTPQNDASASDEQTQADANNLNSDSPANDAPIQRKTADTPQNDASDSGEQTQADGYNLNSDSPTNDAPIQRTAHDTPQNDVSDFSEQTSADVNNLNNDSPANDAPIQRTAHDTPQNDVPDSGEQTQADVHNLNSDSPANDAPIQRKTADTSQNDYSDFGEQTWADVHNLNSDSPANDAPIQRKTADTPQNDASDSGEQTQADVHNLNSDSPANDAPIQRNAYDTPQNDVSDFGEQTWADANNLNNDSTANDAPIQRNASDTSQNDYSDLGEQTWADVNNLNSDSPANDAPIQRKTADTSQNDVSDFGEQTWADVHNLNSDSSTNDAPIQRKTSDTSQNDYSDLGEQTWADVHNLNNDAPNDAPIQRNEYDTPQNDASDSGEQTQVDVNNLNNDVPTNDAPIQRTTADTSQNDYSDLGEQTWADVHNLNNDSSTNNAPIQRKSRQDQDDHADYLPKDFDPTPKIYNFESVAKAKPSPTSLQREAQDPMPSHENQPVDLFNALSQIGTVKSKDPIQRETNAHNDVTEDQTWVDANNYSPSPQPTDTNTNQQDVDLFSALSQEGVVQKRDTPSVQRTSDHHDNVIGDDMANLYNDMMQSGGIQQTSQSDTTVERKASPEARTIDFSEALQRAQQPSTAPISDMDGVIEAPIQLDRSIDPIAASEQANSASTNSNDTLFDTENEDKAYLDQLARDVFRVIKHRLREEKERRG